MQFLERFKASPAGQASEDEVDTINALLSNTFAVDPVNPETVREFELPQTLESIVSAAAAAPSHAAASSSSSSSSSSCSSSSSSAGMGTTFESFRAKLEEMGFFRGVVPGSPEYESRIRMAKAKFDETSQNMKSSSPGPSAADKAAAEELKNAGNEALQAKNFEGAVASYSQAIKLDSTNAVYFSNRAAAYIHLHSLDLAQADCEKAIQLNASFPRAHARLGSVFMQKGMPEQAVPAYEKAVQLDPTNEQFAKQLAEARAALSESMGTPAGMPDMSSLFGGNGGLDMGALLQNVDISSILQQAQQNPEMMQAATQMAMQMFGQGGNPNGGGEGKKDGNGGHSNMYS